MSLTTILAVYAATIKYAAGCLGIGMSAEYRAGTRLKSAGAGRKRDGRIHDRQVELG
jgi:hypothetical protein